MAHNTTILYMYIHICARVFCCLFVGFVVVVVVVVVNVGLGRTPDNNKHPDSDHHLQGID